MLNKFNSNARKLNRSIPKINPNTITNLDLTGSLSNIIIPAEKSYQSTYRKNPFSNEFINTHNIINSDVTASLSNIEIPSESNYDSYTKSNPNPNNIINNKNTIEEFHTQILQYSSRYVKKEITGFNSELNQFYVSSSLLDYGTEEPSPENFEIMIDGLHIPGIYKVEQSGSTVVVTILQNDFVSWDLIDNNQRVIVYGKFLT